MTPMSTTGRRRVRSRVGFAGLATALLLAGTGCGSRASDGDVVDALRAAEGYSAAVGVDRTAVDAAASPGSGLVGAAGATGTDPATGTGSSAGSGVAGAGSSNTGSDVDPAPKPDAKVPTAPKGAASATTANKSLVKIGILGVFSGLLGAVSEGGPKTLAAWVAHTNAQGGLNGHPLRLIVADDGGDPSTSMTLVRRLVESDKIIALVSSIRVFGFAQIEKYTREKGIPLIGGDNIDPGWAASTNTFPVSAPLVIQSIIGLKLLLAQGGSKIGILYCLEVASLCQYLNEEVKKSEVGKNVVESFQVSLVAPSYTNQCIRMKQSGVDVLWLAMDTAGAARAVQNCATQGLTPKTMLLGVDATKSMPTIPALADALVPNAVFPTQAKGVPAIDRYRDVMAVYGPTVGESGIGALAWASAELFGLAGRNLSDTPTSGELYEALWHLKNETLGG